MKKILILLLVIAPVLAWAQDTKISNLSGRSTPFAINDVTVFAIPGVSDYKMTWQDLTNDIIAGLASQSYANTAAQNTTNGYLWGSLYDAAGRAQAATNGFPWMIESLVTNTFAGHTLPANVSGSAATAGNATNDSAGNPLTAKLTANQTITVNGDATGSGTTAISLTATNIQPPTTGSAGYVLTKTATGVGFSNKVASAYSADTATTATNGPNGAFGTAAYTASTAYDSSGAASTVQSYATGISNLLCQSFTNAWSANAALGVSIPGIGMNTNYTYIVSGGATITSGLSTFGNVNLSTSSYGELEIINNNAGVMTFTNSAAIHFSDGLTTRSVTNATSAEIAVKIMPGQRTNAWITYNP